MSRLPDRDPAMRDGGAVGGRRAARGTVAAASTTRRSRTVRSGAVTGCLSGRLRNEVRVEDVAVRVVPGLEPPHGAEVRFDRVTCVAGRESACAGVPPGLQFPFTAVDRVLIFDNPIGLVISFLEVSEVAR